MPIEDYRCFACERQLDLENYYYVYTGRLQQGVQSDPKNIKEYTLCKDCFNQINAELLVSIQKRKKQKQGDSSKPV